MARGCRVAAGTGSSEGVPHRTSQSTVALRRQDLAFLARELVCRQHPSISHAFQSFKLSYWIGSGRGLLLRAGPLGVQLGSGLPRRAILLSILLAEQSHAPTVARRSSTNPAPRLPNARDRIDNTPRSCSSTWPPTRLSPSPRSFSGRPFGGAHPDGPPQGHLRKRSPTGRRTIDGHHSHCEPTSSVNCGRLGPVD
jgi:hypothetical protein